MELTKTEKSNAVQPASTATDNNQQYLTFLLGGDPFALKILNIREIIQYGELTEVPMMPKFIRGVINLRGKVVPVVDLSARFGKSVTQISRRTSIIIIEMENDDDAQSIGIVVDSVNEVVDIMSSDIEPPPSFGAKIRPDFISGMAKKEGRFIIVLNLDQVLSLDEMVALGQTMHGGLDMNTEAENDA
ncbi:purine-binding chemotaxis protein CheW [Undibacterium sp. LX40W]|uniref:Purine-binding chemotaxis protein CheW n=2 Tax=Oxalobacteraceae TaxID=75682 RepID=A0A923HNN5_9BURK|nr:purine-binding chemotaxis protein CheW [Undibacterium nitidum]MBC3892668.1 purine-binding chemotaxis protein CheW [Undibacterium sp. LX40W]